LSRLLAGMEDVLARELIRVGTLFCSGEPVRLVWRAGEVAVFVGEERRVVVDGSTVGRALVGSWARARDVSSCWMVEWTEAGVEPWGMCRARDSREEIGVLPPAAFTTAACCCCCARMMASMVIAERDTGGSASRVAAGSANRGVSNWYTDTGVSSPADRHNKVQLYTEGRGNIHVSLMSEKNS